MTNQQSILNKLSAFFNKDKFSTSAWNERGLNPSDKEMCDRLEFLFNDCANNLIESIKQDNNQKKLKRILKNSLTNFNCKDFDTEEREFICDYFFQLSNIISVDFKDELNGWLYGKTLGTLFKISSLFRGKEKIAETISRDCTKCGSKLETFILRRQDGIPDHSWSIIQCNNCKEYNLLSVGPNIKEYKFGNYTSVESLDKNEYTEEQATARLEQIKFFRKQ